MNVKNINREDLMAQLHIERKRAAGRIAILRKEIRERNAEIEALEARLRAIDESEGYLR